MRHIGKVANHNYSQLLNCSLRIKRNCSTDEFLQNRCKEYKGYLKSQNYPVELVDKQFDKALSIPRAELLRKKVKPAKKVSPLVLDYNPMPSKFRVASSRNQREENGGCSKCNKKCDLCKNYLIQASKFQSSATGRQ